MSSILDIIQSVIIAGIIVTLVIGVHFITIKASTENRIMQDIHGIANSTVAILQDELKWLQSITGDSLAIASDSLSFQTGNHEMVSINAFEDSLVVRKFNGGLLVEHNNYRLGLRDRLLADPLFRFCQVDSAGTVLSTGPFINTDAVHLIRLNISISSRADQLYSGSEEFWYDLERDVFLHSVWLPKAGN